VPCVAIVSPWNRSRLRKPTSLTHSGLRVFSHELGHAIYSFAQGVKAKGPRDFVEVPSTLAENWMHVPEVLQSISCHYTYLKPQYLEGWKDRWKNDHPSKNLPPQPPRQAPLNMFSEISYQRHPKHDMYDTLKVFGYQWLISLFTTLPRKS
jgi:metallopeptidase MepB